MSDQRIQWAWYAASTICLIGGVLLGTVGVTMIITGLQTTGKLEDKVWEVSLLIVGFAFLLILLGSVGCTYARSRHIISNREQSIIKCIAFHSNLSDGTSVPPCCSNSDDVKIWTTINPHSRMAWNGEENEEDDAPE